MERNKFLVFCWAFIPGAGQMYLNMMKKGLAIMVMFWSVIAVTALLSMEALLFILPIIWFYSFFDTFNSARYNYDQRLQLDHRFGEMFIAGGWVTQSMTVFKGKAPVYVAAGLIALGSYLLWRAIVSPILWYITLPDWAYQILRNIPNTFVAIAIITAGVLMLKREKKASIIPYDEED